MLILADEDVDAPIVTWLRNEGYDVLWIAEHAPGAVDADVLELGQKLKRVVVTADLDFGELIHRRGQPSVGVVLLRLKGLPPAGLLRMFQRGWRAVAARAKGSFCVITPGRTRIRPLDAPNESDPIH